jgi:F0F1-type ATP synthase membrane subunit c/vacuolar-type H+-ATPase subunit K
MFDYCCRHLSDTNWGGIIPLPVVAVPLMVAGGGAAASVGIGYAINKATGSEYTQREMVGDAILGAIPGVAFTKGMGNIGYRLYRGRKYLKMYKPGVPMQTAGKYSTFGVGQTIVSNISVKEARRNVILYAALGGAPAVRAIGYSTIVNEILDRSFAQRTSRPRTETQRIKSSRNVGKRKTQKTIPRRNGRCPNGYRYNAKLNACVRKK